MKKYRIIFWVTTGFIFLFETVMPALTSHTELAVEGIRNLGYPDYFRIHLTIFKIMGGFALIIPAIPARIKEWAYAGFGITFISAFVSHSVVSGWGGQTILPVVVFLFLIASYISYHKLRLYKSFESNNLNYGKTSTPAIN